MKIARPIAVGADRALVRLASGEYLCVDTTTFEGLGYMLGWQHEVDVVRVFRTFLTQRSVVLDIGANFGLYTALSASIVKSHGRLYAFEGNPRIFESLERTIAANDLYLNPNIVVDGNRRTHHGPAMLHHASYINIGAVSRHGREMR